MRELRRFLRWGRVRFLRRRLPYLIDVMTEPLWWVRRPDLAWLVFRIRRAIRQGETIIEA